jgi:HAD superfamily hydrolase (TIGR01509 family)
VYEACLFDYGNTLVEFDRPQLALVLGRLRDELCRRFGAVEEQAVREALDRLYGLPHQGPEPTYRELPAVEQMAMLLDDLYGKDSRSSEVVAAADAALQDIFVQSIRIAPAHRELLGRLAARMPLGLVSNYPSGEAIRRSLSLIGIDQHFKAVVISGEVGLCKPHPRLFRDALAALGSDPARTLFVGDRWDADLCGARDCGLRSCHMIGFLASASFDDYYRIYRPDHIARSLEEVAEILGVR